MQEYGLPLVFGVFILVPAAAKIMADGFDWLLWLYGIIVGLAIKDLLEYSLPHLIHRGADQSYLPHPQLGIYPEVIRFFTALFLMIRFYLGAAFYFGLAHEADSAAREFPRRNFGTDFVLGILHFLGFVILAMTINMHEPPVFAFPLVVSFILGYDVFWYVFTFKLDTSDLTRWWAIMNAATLVLGGFLYLLIYVLTHDPVRAELYALWLVLLVTLLDLGLMMNKKPFFQPIEAMVTRRRRSREEGP